MREHEPSRTAQGVARRRAVHQLIDRPLVFEDPLALKIIGRAQEDAIRERIARGVQRRYARYLRAFLAVRSRVAEDTLAAMVANGIDQYVILGAGLDTFGYRNPYPGLKVFEVDHPATQSWKRARLAESHLQPPDSLTFVPVNFERQDFAEELERAGFVPGSGAFFSWLGVTSYLTRDVVLETLAKVARVIGTRGGIVFDYGEHQRALGLVQRIGFELLAAQVRAIGEPWRSSFDPETLLGEVRAAGFARAEDLNGDELNRRYFSGRNDGLQVRGLGHIMRAYGL